MALALLLWSTGALHLFFLFLPVFLFTILSYILLAKASGAGKGKKAPGPPAPGEASRETAAPEENSPGPAGPPGRVGPSARRGADPFTWFLGGLAALSLLACLVLPLVVFLAPPEDYGVTFDWFRNWLLFPTLLYFLAAPAFAWRRKREARP